MPFLAAVLCQRAFVPSTAPSTSSQAACVRHASNGAFNGALPPSHLPHFFFPPRSEVCSLDCRLLDVPGAVAEEVAEVLLAYGAQSVAVQEFRPAGAAEQVRLGFLPCILCF